MPQAATRRGAVILIALASGASAFAGADPWGPPAGFYDSVTSTGPALKAQLNMRMTTGHTQRSYGDFRQSARIHDADPDTSGNILLGYNRASVSGTWNSGATWNREHVWPQSLQPGSASNSSRGNLGDPHALRPLNPSINSSRGNKPFAFGDTIGSYRSLGQYYFVGEADRGDIARSLFYSDTRYTNLTLVNGAPSSNQMGDLSSLIEWHYLDVPDEFERRRNHTIFSPSYNPLYSTNNRNAYVDLPGVVWSVYVDQANDARLFVGKSADTDGSSTLLLDAEPVFVGSPPPATLVSISRDGDDGVYFSVTALDSGALADSGALYALPINGADSASFEAGFASGATDASGLVSAAFVIDNLDVTTGAGPGRGANDANDVVMVDLMVFDRAEASFDQLADVDLLEVDLGEIEFNGGDASTRLAIWNIGGPGPLVANLDVVPVGGTGDDDRFSVSLDSDVSVTPLGATGFMATLHDDITGAFSADFTFRVYDDRSISGYSEGAPLTLRLLGEVASACPADLDGDGDVASGDLALLLSDWGGNGAGDLDGNGSVDSADLATLLGAWGPCDD